MVLYALPIAVILLLVFCALLVNYHFGVNLASLLLLVLLVLVSERAVRLTFGHASFSLQSFGPFLQLLQPSIQPNPTQSKRASSSDQSSPWFWRCSGTSARRSSRCCCQRCRPAWRPSPSECTLGKRREETGRRRCRSVQPPPPLAHQCSPWRASRRAFTCPPPEASSAPNPAQTPTLARARPPPRQLLPRRQRRGRRGREVCAAGRGHRGRGRRAGAGRGRQGPGGGDDGGLHAAVRGAAGRAGGGRGGAGRGLAWGPRRGGAGRRGFLDHLQPWPVKGRS